MNMQWPPNWNYLLPASRCCYTVATSPRHLQFRCGFSGTSEAYPVAVCAPGTHVHSFPGHNKFIRPKLLASYSGGRLPLDLYNIRGDGMLKLHLLLLSGRAKLPHLIII